MITLSTLALIHALNNVQNNYQILNETFVLKFEESENFKPSTTTRVVTQSLKTIIKFYSKHLRRKSRSEVYI